MLTKHNEAVRLNEDSTDIKDVRSGDVFTSDFFNNTLFMCINVNGSKHYVAIARLTEYGLTPGDAGTSEATLSKDKIHICKETWVTFDL